MQMILVIKRKQEACLSLIKRSSYPFIKDSFATKLWFDKLLGNCTQANERLYLCKNFLLLISYNNGLFFIPQLQLLVS